VATHIWFVPSTFAIAEVPTGIRRTAGNNRDSGQWWQWWQCRDVDGGDSGDSGDTGGDTGNSGDSGNRDMKKAQTLVRGKHKKKRHTPALAPEWCNQTLFSLFKSHSFLTELLTCMTWR
jgi:hypothetical protein